MLWDCFWGLLSYISDKCYQVKKSVARLWSELSEEKKQQHPWSNNLLWPGSWPAPRNHSRIFFGAPSYTPLEAYLHQGLACLRGLAHSMPGNWIEVSVNVKWTEWSCSKLQTKFQLNCVDHSTEINQNPISTPAVEELRHEGTWIWLVPYGTTTCTYHCYSN